jgi:hypothetical protein
MNDKVVYIEKTGSMTTAMFGTVVRLGAMKISVAWEDGEERSVSKRHSARVLYDRS